MQRLQAIVIVGGPIVMRWQPGPKRLGCVYHQRAVRGAAADSLVIDVFVMPRIAARRPIAITIGRYRGGESLVKVQWQLRRPADAASSGPELAALFEKIGVSAKPAAELAAEVQQFIGQEAANLTTVLATLTKPASQFIKRG